MSSQGEACAGCGDGGFGRGLGSGTGEAVCEAADFGEGWIGGSGARV
jgi:hypothetical protein